MSPVVILNVTILNVEALNFVLITQERKGNVRVRIFVYWLFINYYKSKEKPLLALKGDTHSYRLLLKISTISVFYGHRDRSIHTHREGAWVK
jgi:hypothetical protein